MWINPKFHYLKIQLYLLKGELYLNIIIKYNDINHMNYL